MAGFTLTQLWWGIGVLGVTALVVPFMPSPVCAQFATSDRVNQPGFWPTQTIYPRDSYAGPRACADCHTQIFHEAEQTSMAHTFMMASKSDILAGHPDLTFNEGAYHYEIRTEKGTSTYVASSGPQEQSAQLIWAFGTNRVAQSWLFLGKNGDVHEARVTYFRSLKRLNFTPGRAIYSPENLKDAMYREVGQQEVYKCFSCHTTASGFGSSFATAGLIPGVSCEACHGPGKDHINAMEDISFTQQRQNSPKENTDDEIFDPAKLSPEASVDFCGSCHGSYWDVSLSGITGVGTVRFQPFRLEESKCWREGNDSYLKCVSCHNPHEQVDTVAADYDHVCLRCHASKMAEVHPAVVKQEGNSHSGAACPVATHDCTTCHMPEVYVPSMQSSFPDHRIRIARESEPYPD